MKPMNAYESMLLTDAAKLEQTIEGLINKCINEDAEAKAELEKVSEVIDFDYEISADVSFTPYGSTLYSKATYSSIAEYNDAEDNDGYYYDFENENGISWDDECTYGSFEVDKTDSEVEVDINGLTDNASQEAKDGYFAVTMLQRTAENKKRQEEVVERLRKQLQQAEEELKG